MDGRSTASDNGGGVNYLTKESFLEIIKSQEYQATLTGLIEPIVSALELRMNRLESDLRNTNKVVRQQTLEINKLKREISAVSSANEDLQRTVHAQKRDERLKNLRVSGLTGTESEIKEKFIKLANEKLEVEIKPDEIDVRKPGKDNAPAQVMFTNIWRRNTCFQQKRKLKGTNTFISDDLSPEDAKLFYETRKMKKEEKIFATWTNKNVIFVKTGYNSIPMAIKDIDHLKEITKPKRKSTSQLYYDAVEMDSNDDTDEEFNGFSTVEIAAAIEKNKDIKRKVKELINSR